ncbi:MAG TPA: DUF1801 domain-containing protein [Devosia sp.]|nr:DUF1801 domain-containing protein [Devosia sp.]
MTKGKPATVASYIAGFPPDIAFILERLRETVLKAAPDAVEEIKYDMPLFRLPGGYIFYLGAWKKHVGLYPIYPQEPALEAEIAPLRSGKDTVKLIYARPIPYPLISRLVKARAKALKAKAP